MARKLKIRAERLEGRQVYYLTGNVVAGARDALTASTANAGEDCIFNWSGVTITSSDGIREWIGFVEAFADGRRIAYAECPPSIVLSFNLFPRCVARATVLSAYGTFVCPLCAKERAELVVIGEDVDAEGCLKRKPSCEACVQEMELILPEAEYFAFLSADLAHRSG